MIGPTSPFLLLALLLPGPQDVPPNVSQAFRARNIFYVERPMAEAGQIAFSADGRFLACVAGGETSERVLTVWDVKSGAKRARAFDGRIGVGSYGPRVLAVRGGRLFDLDLRGFAEERPTAIPPKALEGEFGAGTVRDLLGSPAGTHVLLDVDLMTGSKIVLLPRLGGTPVGLQEGTMPGWLYSHDAAFTPDGQSVLLASRSGYPCSRATKSPCGAAYDLRGERLKRPKNLADSVDVSPEGRQLVWTDGKEIVLSEAGTFRELGRVEVRANDVRFLGEKRLLTNEGWRLTIRRLPDLEVVHEHRLKDWPWDLVVTPDGKNFALVYEDRIALHELPEVITVALALSCPEGVRVYRIRR